MTSFSDLGLSPETVTAVSNAGYTEPTPIQEQAIPFALQGRDVLGIAQTGTGKTAAFTLPMIDKLVAGRSKARMPRSLVICPTRELADQVALAFDKYAKGRKLTWVLLIGGVSFDEQVRKLDRGVDVLIATPGRLLDLFERGRMLLTGVQIMVVDEADRMLDMGFIPDIEKIFKLTPAKKQTLFFSATMPPEITRLTKQFLNDPIRVEATPPATTATTIAQHIARIPSSDPKSKRAALRALVGMSDVRNGIVFCNRKSEVDTVAKSLKRHGFDAAPIHGDLDQSVRTRTLESFRNGELKLLVASDVAARGLDIPDVSHVFNFDVPHHADDYVHRIGRTGRAGKKGDTFMIVTPADGRSLDKVLKLIGQQPDEVKLDLDLSTVGAATRSTRAAPTDRAPATERPKRGERAEGERPARGRGRRKEAEPAVEAEAVAAVAAEETPAEAPIQPQAEPEVRAAREREPRRERGPRRGREPRAEQEPRAERELRPEREARAEEPRADREPREPRREEAEAASPQQSRRERRPESSRGAPAREERGSERDRNERERSDRESGVVGFGADVPAFLRR